LSQNRHLKDGRNAARRKKSERRKMKKVKDVMSQNLEVVSPDATLEEACKRMKEADCGILPVGAEDDIEGVITDRDVAIRAVAEGVDTGIAIVRDYMTPAAHVCGPEDSIQAAAQKMHDKDVSRLLVYDRGENLVGILSFGHVMRSDAEDGDIAETMFCAVGRKAGPIIEDSIGFNIQH
jgi:CBS domain-containing protein